jgi:DNA mismatch repair protein MutS2
MINEHTIDTLEFPKIISLIDGKCRTPFGREEIDQIQPLFDGCQIELKLTEISQMKDIINFGLAFPLYRLEDCRELLEKSRVEGIFLEPKEILLLLELVEVSIEINGYDKEGRDKFPAIAEYLTQVRAFPELKKEIRRVINEEGEIRDNASSKLKSVRLELTESKRKIVSRLERILASHQKQSGWQDDVVTMRNGRYVIPIPTSQYHTDRGILHDRSQSGATLYIEPEQTVELNNRINLLMQEERLELDRILRALTAEIATRSEPLLENTRLIGKLDAIYACAKFSNEIKGNQPAIADEPTFDLVEARHPLLIVQYNDAEKVVPTTIGLDNSRRAVLVTGPNTGGKTITLKTVGLSILMAQSGLHISASEKSTIGIFESLFADIGDEQSIEQSLSTFSSHMRNIVHGLAGASESALLLFDEIGVGTDPKEGAALAESIILYGVKKGARLLATTHYSQLKTMATEHPEIENASLEFDRRTLAPTYRLHLGLPGSSYAVEIASRLGLPQEICQEASSLVGDTEKSLDTLIASLQAELATLKQDRTELTERLTKARQLEEYYRTQSDRLKTSIQQEKEKALAETEEYLEQTRREIEKLVADIRRSQASKKAVKEFHRNLQQREQKIKDFQSRLEPEKPGSAVFNKGDVVEILTLKQQGEIEQLLGSDRAKVKIGNVHTTVALRNLRKITLSSDKKRLQRGTRYSVEEAERPEIHLRGMTVEEALESLERFLDRAVVAGFSQVYIVHGKGTGALRRTLTQYLKNHPEVVSLRLGDWNEGGIGVTIAKLKE